MSFAVLMRVSLCPLTPWTLKLPLSHDGSSQVLALSERELDDLFAGLDLDVPTRH